MGNTCNEDLKESNLGQEDINNNLDATIDDLKFDSEEKLDDTNEFVEEFNKKVNECEELTNRLMRLQADFNNYKKRIEKERESLFSYATQELITLMLPVIDNFDRALGVNPEEVTVDSLYQGVEMVYKQFIDVLKSNGLEEIEAKDKEFDPNYHHAVAQEESKEHDEDIITEVFLKGYKLKDKVIRPSMVKVSK